MLKIMPTQISFVFYSALLLGACSTSSKVTRRYSSLKPIERIIWNASRQSDSATEPILSAANQMENAAESSYRFRGIFYKSSVNTQNIHTAEEIVQLFPEFNLSAEIAIRLIRSQIDLLGSPNYRERMQRALNRMAQYTPLLEGHHSRNSIPKSLYFLPLIESGFQNLALSKARAVGLWQFMPGTGKEYGLQLNHWSDERRNPFKSTNAALHYLQDLYNVFGSWELALASYNMGPNKTKYLIIKHNQRDYWSLLDQNIMPNETRNYVAKFLAAVLIADRPRAYGYDIPEVQDTWAGNFALIRENVTLQQVAEKAQCDLETLNRVNPDLLKAKILGRQRGGFNVVIPQQCRVPESLVADARDENSVSAAPDRIDRHRQKFKSKVKAVQAWQPVRNRLYHVVRRGDDLKKIAQKYRVSLPQLLKANRIKNSRGKLPPGQKIKIPS